MFEVVFITKNKLVYSKWWSCLSEARNYLCSVFWPLGN